MNDTAKCLLHRAGQWLNVTVKVNF